MLCNNQDISTIEQNEGGILGGRTRSDCDERKQRKIYDIDRPGIPVFGGESGKALRGRPVLAPNFVPTYRHMALASSARPSFVNDDHDLPVVSVTINANSTGLVIGEKAAVMIAEGCGKRN
jgi:hypothetical protein